MLFCNSIFNITKKKGYKIQILALAYTRYYQSILWYLLGSEVKISQGYAIFLNNVILTILSRHKTSVGGPEAPTKLKPGTWICTAGKTVVFLAPTLALWTMRRLSPSCMPFKPAMA